MDYHKLPCDRISLSNEVSTKITPVVSCRLSPYNFSASRDGDRGSNLTCSSQSVHVSSYTQCRFIVGVSDGPWIKSIKQSTIRVENNKSGCRMGCCETCKGDFSIKVPGTGWDISRYSGPQKLDR